MNAYAYVCENRDVHERTHLHRSHVTFVYYFDYKKSICVFILTELIRVCARARSKRKRKEKGEAHTSLPECLFL